MLTEGQQLVAKKFSAGELRTVALDLFQQIKHGDAEQWLRDALCDYFDGHKVRRQR